MKIRQAILAGASGLMLLAGPSGAIAGHANTLLTAYLDGREEVADNPGNRSIVGDPDGRGQAYVFGIDNDELTLCYIVEVEKISGLDQPPGGAFKAHIHEGPRGENGMIVANLAWPQDGQAADCLTEGEQGKFPTGEMGLVQRILTNPQDFYVNIHNDEYPGGALRGQLEYTADHSHDEDQAAE